MIVHEGEAVITDLRDFETLAREDVILTHRLLKNSIPEQKYVAVTNDFLLALLAPLRRPAHPPQCAQAPPGSTATM